ncbi:MAG: GAP family protein, partial [Coriobacteriales bacterium]|nr:GAP family protein [Coriobacteriales bacterium]
MKVFLAVLPMAFVMSAGPQIVTAVFLATSERWAANSLSFLTGVAIATTIGTSVAYWAATAAQSATGATTTGGANALDYLLIVLLLFLMIRVFLKRKVTEPPKWMAKLQSATPKLSITMGFLLYMLMPTDIVSMITVGGYLARNGLPWASVFIFLGATLLIAGSPFLIALLMGKRA